ncbi:MAG: efflux RND transporter periplasmic adaptor subunit [Clostridiales Family XIII bacterium]|jgi:HlyD family secretion protein|nr:efflux RND transporter periplasmic adaptor subunit [Clostridiales Family XIII bacterium]
MDGTIVTMDDVKRKGTKKKKIVIIVSCALVVIAIGVCLKLFVLGGSGIVEQTEEANTVVHVVGGSDQVFIDGTITPSQSEEFMRDSALGKLGDLEVADGQTIPVGTVLYRYTNTELDSSISELQRSITEQTAARDKAARQRDLELRQLDAKPAEEGVDKNLERENILLTYDIDSMNAAINALAAQRDEMQNSKVTTVTAPFAGKVFIPQEKTANSALLKLTSDDSYVMGTVNERDINKIAVGQKCTINVVSSGKSVTGEITYIADQPEGASEGEEGNSESSGMAKFTVKISLDSKDGIKNGFHVQAAINLTNDLITIPAKSVIKDGDKNYVLVDDFGSILKKEIVLDAESEGAKKLDKDTVAVKTGLEAEDLVIVSSDKDLKDGDPTPPTKMDKEENEGGGKKEVING